MSLNNFTPGVNTNFSTELNENFNVSNGFIDIPTTNLNVSVPFGSANSGVTDSKNQEFTGYTVSKGDYLIIQPLLDCFAKSDDDFKARATFKIEIKETGGSYSTIFDEVVFANKILTSDDVTTQSLVQFGYYHELTQGQKDNGFDIRITTTANPSASSGASLTVKQLVFKEIAGN